MTIIGWWQAEDGVKQQSPQCNTDGNYPADAFTQILQAYA